MQKVKRLLTIHYSLLTIFAICYLLFAIPVLAVCGIGPFEEAVCCPKENCYGTNYGEQGCGSDKLCCESCAPSGIDIGRKFKLGGRSIRTIFPTLGSFISTILPNIYTIASIILFLLLIFGGFTFIVSAGKAQPEGVQKGKNAITAALIGFALIFTSWWIIQIVEAITGIEILGSQ